MYQNNQFTITNNMISMPVEKDETTLVFGLVFIQQICILCLNSLSVRVEGKGVSMTEGVVYPSSADA